MVGTEPLAHLSPTRIAQGFVLSRERRNAGAEETFVPKKCFCWRNAPAEETLLPKKRSCRRNARAEETPVPKKRPCRRNARTDALMTIACLQATMTLAGKWQDSPTYSLAVCSFVIYKWLINLPKMKFWFLLFSFQSPNHWPSLSQLYLLWWS